MTEQYDQTADDFRWYDTFRDTCDGMPCNFSPEIKDVLLYGDGMAVIDYCTPEEYERNMGGGLTLCENCAREIENRTVRITTYSYIASALINGDFSGLEYDAEENSDDSLIRLANAIIDKYGIPDGVSEGHYGRPDDGCADIHDNMYGDVATYVFPVNK